MLRLLLVLLSGTLYHDPGTGHAVRYTLTGPPLVPHYTPSHCISRRRLLRSQVVDPFCSEAVSPLCPLLPTLFYSLLNCSVTYDPVGWGIPYGSAFASDHQERLMEMALQVLLVLLDYAPNQVLAAGVC